MRGIWARQSELSLVSAIAYFAGGIIAALVTTVFRDPANTLVGVSAVVAVLAFSLVAVFLALGRRTTVRPALLLMCVSGAMVLVSAGISTRELRIINSGLLFAPIILYLVWFGSVGLARAFGWPWLVAYCSIVWVRFGIELAPFLMTLILTSMLLAELIGRYKARLEATSLTDPLCDVWNKRGFDAVMSRTIRKTHRAKQPLSVLYLDLDDLKLVNDTRGHYEGDRLLCAFTARIEELIRAEDEFARLGGDEFALLLPGTDLEAATAVAARLRAQTAGTGWSFGVAQLRSGEGQDEFLARADRLMLEEKRRRKADRELAGDS